jgi:hypothetical protein
MTTVTDAIEAVLAGGVVGLFKAGGFRKKGRRFIKWKGEVCQSAHFYSSKSSGPGNCMFTIEAGVFVKYVDETTSGRPFPKSLIDATPVFCRRFGASMQNPLVTPFAEFWTVRNVEDAATVAKEVRALCAEGVLPFLERLGDEFAILNELQVTTTDANYVPVQGRVVIMQAKLGLLSEAQNTLSTLAAKLAPDAGGMREIDTKIVDEFVFRVRDYVRRSLEQDAPPAGCSLKQAGNPGAAALLESLN